jgi:hypothetical protein
MTAPVSLFDVIAYVETKNCPPLMRFEPATYARVASGAWTPLLDKIAQFNQCSQSTARMIYSTSWGAAQLMGFNLYDLGYEQPVVDFAADPIAQAAMFDKFVWTKGISSDVHTLATVPAARRFFARVYNGDTDAYEPLIVQALEHFGIEVTK